MNLLRTAIASPCHYRSRYNATSLFTLCLSSGLP